MRYPISYSLVKHVSTLISLLPPPVSAFSVLAFPHFDSSPLPYAVILPFLRSSHQQSLYSASDRIYEAVFHISIMQVPSSSSLRFSYGSSKFIALTSRIRRCVTKKKVQVCEKCDRIRQTKHFKTGSLRAISWPAATSYIAGIVDGVR